ncbi:MAG: hypothetical protein JST59_01440 [Actinobacteria bacterium]|nr:hypothetical protein [Actinomycetota bacterium]
MLQVLNKFPVFLFAFVLLLRKLVKRLSLLYEMEIEDYSVYEMRTDPELDILWLLGEFFEVSFVMYQLDSKIIKEQKFKVNEQEPICLVRNDDPSSDWTYLCLRDHRVREMSDIQAEDRPPNENFWKTNSSASELKIITYFDRMP